MRTDWKENMLKNWAETKTGSVRKINEIYVCCACVWKCARARITFRTESKELSLRYSFCNASRLPLDIWIVGVLFNKNRTVHFCRGFPRQTRGVVALPNRSDYNFTLQSSYARLKKSFINESRIHIEWLSFRMTRGVPVIKIRNDTVLCLRLRWISVYWKSSLLFFAYCLHARESAHSFKADYINSYIVHRW